MKILRRSKTSSNVIATIAIGAEYLKDWERFARPSWERYCEKHDLGLIVFSEELIGKNDPLWKKPNWQKLLIGSNLSETDFNVDNVCFLDTDILISPIAPNVFDCYDGKSLGLVSQVKKLPYPIESVLRRVAFFRHHEYSADYPLDSALFMRPREIFKHMGTKEFDDYVCSGVFLFNLKMHSSLLKAWFDAYTKDTETLTTGEEPIFNVKAFEYGKITWLDYKFQAIWLYEMAWKFPFLYSEHRYDDAVIKSCVRASLLDNYFLHFAGSWYESDMWRNADLMPDVAVDNFMNFQSYCATPVTGQPKGVIRPRA